MPAVDRNRLTRRLLGGQMLLVTTLAGMLWWIEPAQQRQQDVPIRREFTIVAREFGFTPSRIEVNAGDLVRITLVAEDRAYSLAIDAYRILKRASPGYPMTIEFVASQPGAFSFYCSLQIEGCRAMRGELIVR